MKKKLLKKILAGVGITLASVVLVAAIAIGVLWHNEIASVASIKMLVEAHPENRSAPVYFMDVKGDYYYDQFIEEGGDTSDGELIDYIVAKLTSHTCYKYVQNTLSFARDAGDMGKCLNQRFAYIFS